MLNRTATIILLSFLLYCHQANAQQPPMYFQQITTADGLSHNRVNCLLQDKRGFMWIGTNDGLNRYDGRQMEIYRNKPSDTSSISGNIITEIIEDTNEVLWIATADGGISRYNYRLPPSQQFKQYKHHEAVKTSIPTNVVNCLLLEHNKYLWLGTSGAGVLRFDIKREVFEQISIASGTTYLDLCMDNKGNIWGGKQGGGYAIINTQTLQLTLDDRYKNLYAKLPHMAINTLMTDGNDIWLGSWDKVLYSVNSSTKAETVFAPKNIPYSFKPDEILSFAKDKKGNIWIGGKTNGLQYYNKTNQAFYHYSYDAAKAGTIANNRINCVYIDNTGTLWAGTDRGISRSNPALNQFEQVFLPTTTSTPIVIYDFFRDEDNTLWIGTSNGLYLQDENKTIRHVPLQYKGEALQVSKFFHDTETGLLYLGTNVSLFAINKKNKAISLLPNTNNDVVMKRIIESRIVSIIKDTINKHPVLVVLPYGHYLAWYDLTAQRWYSRTDTAKKIVSRFGLKDHLIRKIIKTQPGEWYMATGKQGLGQWQHPLQDKISYFTNRPGVANSISNNNVYDVEKDTKGNFWLSTFGGGLNYFDRQTKKAMHITASPNLSEGIAIDDAGHVWGISNAMLYKYSIIDKSISLFDLPDIEKSGGVKGNIFKDKDGSLLVAGNGYFINVVPHRTVQQSSHPKLYFTDFKIYGTSYSHLLQEKKIALSYQQNYFSFEFAAPQFSGTQGLQYYCKMEGEDHDWVALGNRTFASYSNLSGGSYTFRIKVVAAQNKQVAENAIHIIVSPPVWKQWWFYLLCSIAVAAIAYALYRYRINELLKRQEIRNKIAQDLHDSVGSTLSSISVYSQVAKIYHQKSKEKELTDALEKISGTSSEMIAEMSDIVWAINPRNDSMEKILQRMESFARPLLNTKNIACSFHYSPAVKQLNLPMQWRKNFYLIFKEAINNVIKYSDAINMQVSLQQHGQKIELKVTDDGRGFDVNTMKQMAAKSLSGNGLVNMKRRAAEMKGQCTIESAIGQGTTICLQFPIP